MNFLQLVQRACLECEQAQPSSFTTLSTMQARIKDWCMDAWVDVQRMNPHFDFLRNKVEATISEGKSTYTPSELEIDGDVETWGTDQDVDLAYISETDPTVARRNVLLSIAPYSSLERQSVGKTSADYDIPTFWGVNGSDIIFYPTPDKEYLFTGYWYSEPVFLSDETDTPACSRSLHMIIVYGAMMSYGVFDGASEIYSRGAEKYNELIYQFFMKHGQPVRMEKREYYETTTTGLSSWPAGTNPPASGSGTLYDADGNPILDADGNPVTSG